MNARREYNTAWAARKRQAQWEAKARGSRTCPHRHGPSRCATVLEDRVIDGRVVVCCPRCERRRAGICRDCPRPVDGQKGKAVRCASCKAAAVDRQIKESNKRNVDEINQRARARLRNIKRTDPAKYAELQAKKRLYRAAHPERVKAWKRKEALTQNPKRREYLVNYRREQRAEEKRAAALRSYYRKHPKRPKPVCSCGAAIEWAPPGRPPTRCVNCVPASVAAKRRAKIEAWQPPVIPDALRTCLTCDRVLTGRKKKCSYCKSAAVMAARTALAAFREGAA